MLKGYYFITDHALSARGNLADVLAAAAAGALVIQYRNKSGTTRRMYEEAKLLQQAAGKALFLINDRVDIALAVGAAGVHIGSDDMPYENARKLLGPGKVIGVSVCNKDQAREAQRKGADYIGVGPVFSTSTKADAGTPLGLEALKAIKESVSIPVVAIGGITLANVREVIQVGADAVCAISAVVRSSDVAATIRSFQQQFTAEGIDINHQTPKTKHLTPNI